MRTTIAVGQKLFSLNIGTAFRLGTQQVLTPVVVKKVGRRLFTAGVKGKKYDAAYLLENWKQASEFPTSKLYVSKQEYADEVESIRLCGRIGEAFKYGQNMRKLPLGALRQIDQIILNEMQAWAEAKT